MSLPNPEYNTPPPLTHEHEPITHAPETNNTPHHYDKRDAPGLVNPEEPFTTKTARLDNPLERNEIAIAEDNFEAPLAAYSEADAWRGRIEAHLAAIQLMLSKEYLQPEEDEWITLLSAREWAMRRKGRRYLCLWSPVAITGVLFSVLGQSAQFNIVVGWQNLSLPDGTTLTLPGTTASQLVLTRATNWNYGAAI